MYSFIISSLLGFLSSFIQSSARWLHSCVSFYSCSSHHPFLRHHSCKRSFIHSIPCLCLPMHSVPIQASSIMVFVYDEALISRQNLLPHYHYTDHHHGRRHHQQQHHHRQRTSLHCKLSFSSSSGTIGTTMFSTVSCVCVCVGGVCVCVAGPISMKKSRPSPATERVPIVMSAIGFVRIVVIVNVILFSTVTSYPCGSRREFNAKHEFLQMHTMSRLYHNCSAHA